MAMQLHSAIEFLKFSVRARTAHGIHSPFVYDLITEVLYADKNYYNFKKPEAARAELLNDDTVIRVTDLGAGSHSLPSTERRVGDIAKRSGSPLKYLKLLYRIVNHYGCKNILELGTSCGSAASYLAAANASSLVHTVEGCPATADVARDHFRKQNLRNVELLLGDFDTVIAQSPVNTTTYDLIFIDGNHRKEPTLRYFNALKDRLSRDGLFIFDDIHWSGEMTAAWNEIKRSPDVKITIDLFKSGIVTLNPKHTKQDFSIWF